MASATAKPQKRLGEFLNEQQEPFILELYLLERRYSKGYRLNGDSGESSEKPASSGLNKKRKAMLPFSKVLLPALCSKLDFHKESIILTKDYDQRNKHVCVPEDGRDDYIHQFSSARSASVFNPCSDIGEEGNSKWSHEDHNLLSSDTCQNSSVCNMGLRRQRQRCTESALVSMGKIPLYRVPHVAAVWSLLGQSMKKENCTMESRELLLGPNVSKRVVHKIKKMLCVCEREITVAVPTKEDRKQGCYEQFMEPRELGKLICEGKKEWGQQARDGATLNKFMTSDYMNSITEWRNFELHVKGIGIEITDAILEGISNEILSEMIETSANLSYKISS